jgi:hypothetical protein
MSRRLKLECRFKPRNGWSWFLPGLPSWDWYDEVEDAETELVLVGLNHACDTPGSVVGGVYSALYDHHQVSEGKYGFKDGDVIESDATRINKYHSWDDGFGTVDVPAMRFRVESFHVILEEPAGMANSDEN